VTVDPEDKEFMRRALRLAAQARTHPNPMVGAVVVREGQVLGEGWHKGYVDGIATPHAEAMAFAAAGEAARGATVYVTLEPCAHSFRSDGAPRIACAERCITAQVSRVVCPMEDPDTRVSGRGFAMMREAGIEVVVGVEEAAARKLNHAYIRHRTTGLPYITHKAAMTLDGKIAAPGGDSKWVTGEAARAEVHRLRNRSDALIVGIGTVLTDDPQLTTRLSRGNGNDPVRVVIDSRLRLPATSHVARPGTLVLTTEQAESGEGMALEACGVEVIKLPSDSEGRVDVRAVAEFLAERGLLSILLESGGSLAASFWEARLISRALFFIAPKVIGGTESVTPVDGQGLAQIMGNAVQLEISRVRRLGADVAIEAEVKF
jgi:diaminohydroxyphosphoribosylaminopyrimidine deaminase / 5-amino-6-(5-phosphoribosylamino)uracil reductase